MISEPWIQIDVATATTDSMWISRDGDIGLTGRYIDQFRNHDGVCRFSRREIVLTGET